MPLVNFFVYERDRRFVYGYPTSVKCQDDDIVADLQELVAVKLNVMAPRVSLWKPHQFLGIRDTEELRSRLEDNRHRLEQFCDNLIYNGVEELVSSVTLATSSSGRDSTKTVLIAEIMPSPPPQAEAGPQEEEDVIGRSWKMFYNVMNKTLTGKSPSANTKSANYYAHQEHETPFLDGRYAKRSFKANACNTSIHPPSDIIGHTAKLMEAASQISTTEISREKLTRRYLTDILCRGFGQGVNFNRTSSDHLVVATRSVDPAEIAAVALVEEKAELGWGGDPSIQGSFSYLQFWAGADHERIRDATCCPSFIIGIGGPWIVILGAVITSSPIIQRLTDYLWLGHSRVIDDSYALRLAHIFYSLWLAMCTLNDYYMNFTLPSPAEVVNFEYQQPLESDATCVTFLATQLPSDGQDEQQIVVKFVERYGAEAHRLLASKGMAPQLWYCGPIWHGSEHSYGELQMVVMEYVEGQTAASKYSDRPVPETVRESVRRAATCLADNLMVHGDLRRPNIFIESEEEKVMIIDFDWAGKDGVVRYPLHLSRSVQWVEGVEDYGLIKIEHDVAMVNRL